MHVKRYCHMGIYYNTNNNDDNNEYIYIFGGKGSNH